MSFKSDLYRALRLSNDLNAVQRRKANERRIARAFDVPEDLIGLPTPWWRRVWQRLVRKPFG